MTRRAPYSFVMFPDGIMGCPAFKRTLCWGDIKKTFISKITDLFSIDVRSLAFFRIGMASLLIADLLDRTKSFTAFYTNDGVLPTFALLDRYKNTLNFSLHLLNGSASFQKLLFLAAGFFAILMLLGYLTKLATLISWFLLFSLHLRQPMVLNGGDYLLYMLLLWSIFLPLGEYGSVDSFLGRFRKTPRKRILSMGTVALLIQIALIYVFSVIIKAKEEPWWDGQAIYFALTSDFYTKVLGLILLKWPIILKILTPVIFWAEFFAPVFLFMPVRTSFFRMIAMIMVFLLHLGFGLCLELRIFPWVSVLAMSAFLPGSFWDKLSNRLHFLKQKVSKGQQKQTSLREAGAPSLNHFYKMAVCCLTVILQQIIPAIFLAYVITTNIESATGKKIVPGSFLWIGSMFYLYQDWGMFAPPGAENWWIVIRGNLKGGRNVDLLTGESPVSWDKPVIVSAVFENDFWRSYVESLRLSPERTSLLPHCGDYLCRQWNNDHKDENAVESMDTFVMLKEILPDHQMGALKRKLLYHHSCGI